MTKLTFITLVSYIAFFAFPFPVTAKSENSCLSLIEKYEEYLEKDLPQAAYAQGKLRGVEMSLVDARQQGATLEKENSKLSSSVESLRYQNQGLLDQMDICQNFQDNVRSTNQRLQIDLTAEQDYADAMLAERDALAAEKRTLESQLRTKDDKLAKNDEQIVALETEVQVLRTRLEDEHGPPIEVPRSQDELGEPLQSLQAILIQLRFDLEKSQADQAQLASEKETLNAKVEQLRLDVEEKDLLLEAANSKNAILASRGSEEILRIRELEAGRRGLEAQLRDLEAELAESTGKVMAVQQVGQAVIEELLGLIAPDFLAGSDPWGRNQTIIEYAVSETHKDEAMRTVNSINNSLGATPYRLSLTFYDPTPIDVVLGALHKRNPDRLDGAYPRYNKNIREILGDKVQSLVRPEICLSVDHPIHTYVRRLKAPNFWLWDGKVLSLCKLTSDGFVEYPDFGLRTELGHIFLQSQNTETSK